MKSSGNHRVEPYGTLDRREFAKLAGAGALGAALTAGATAATAGEAAAKRVASGLAPVDMATWSYDADSDVYWQVGISYCALPADAAYETMGIFVPGAYFDGQDNGDGTFTCTIDAQGEVGGFTAATAPMVIPVNTPGYSAMAAPSGLTGEAATYAAEGFVYVQAGCRGRDHGAPAGVVDLKAALRYVRANAGLLPGDTDRIFSFGMSGGGAQSALLGATGDSDLYLPYLKAIGADETTGDAVAGSMCWCPITSLDTADAAYEWNLGVSRTGLDEESQRVSDALATAYAGHINGLGLVDAQGTALTLQPSETGIYQAGTYYEHVKAVVERSLDNFLADTEFPYTPRSSGGPGGMGGGMGGRGGMDGPGGTGGGMPDFGDGGPGGGMGGGFGGGGMGKGPGGEIGDLADGAPDEQAAQYAVDGIERAVAETSGASGPYETPADYIASLNADEEWVFYDEASNTATIASVEAFVRALKNASKSLGAFDQLDRSQGENVLFGYGDGSGAHFDATLAEIMDGTEYEKAFAEDLARTDTVGNTVDVRLAMYSPLYYLCDAYGGAGSANVAGGWRIRTGINQSDTALSTEINLALALQAYGCDVDFETVWGQGHTQAERSGSATENFIAWVKGRLA